MPKSESVILAEEAWQVLAPCLPLTPHFILLSPAHPHIPFLRSWFPTHTRLFLASQPLHVLFPVPGMLFPSSHVAVSCHVHFG